jgi:hypothetical protein
MGVRLMFLVEKLDLMILCGTPLEFYLKYMKPIFENVKQPPMKKSRHAYPESAPGAARRAGARQLIGSNP